VPNQRFINNVQCKQALRIRVEQQQCMYLLRSAEQSAQIGNELKVAYKRFNSGSAHFPDQNVNNNRFAI
jgi:hypothetical protein